MLKSVFDSDSRLNKIVKNGDNNLVSPQMFIYSKN